MSFLQPAYLWALSALAVPLAIHLLSRKEGKVIRMGSLRHVHETPTRQFRSIRLNEYVLLMLRLGILALLVMLMSGWYLERLTDRARWVVIEPGLESRSGLASFLDSLDAKGYEARWLLPDFPPVGEAKPLPRVDYLARLEELTRLPVQEVVVVATNRRSGFSGPRAALPEHIRWVDVEATPTSAVVSRIQIGSDSVQVREGNFANDATVFSSFRERGSDGKSRDTVRIAIASDPEYETDRKTLAVVLEVIKDNSPALVVVSQLKARNYVPGGGTDWVFWLSDAPAPATDATLIAVAGTGGPKVIEQVSQKRFEITIRINSETAVEHNLAAHLAGLLIVDTGATTVVDSLDARVVPTTWAFSTVTPGPEVPVTTAGNNASGRLLAVILLVFVILERIIAYRRNQ